MNRWIDSTVQESCRAVPCRARYSRGKKRVHRLKLPFADTLAATLAEFAECRLTD